MWDWVIILRKLTAKSNMQLIFSTEGLSYKILQELEPLVGFCWSCVYSSFRGCLPLTYIEVPTGKDAIQVQHIPLLLSSKWISQGFESCIPLQQNSFELIVFTMLPIWDCSNQSLMIYLRLFSLSHPVHRINSALEYSLIPQQHMIYRNMHEELESPW